MLKCFQYHGRTYRTQEAEQMPVYDKQNHQTAYCIDMNYASRNFSHIILAKMELCAKIVKILIENLICENLGEKNYLFIFEDELVKSAVRNIPLTDL